MPVNVFGGLWGNAELSQDHALSPVSAEIAVTMIFWGMAVGSIVAGAASDAMGHRNGIVVGGALMAMFCFSVAIYSPSQSLLFLSVCLFFAGFFCGGQMLTFAMAKEGVSSENAGTVIAFVNMLGIGGALVFQPLVGGLVDLESGDFTIPFLTIPICLALAAVLALFVSEERHPDHTD